MSATRSGNLHYVQRVQRLRRYQAALRGFALQYPALRPLRHVLADSELTSVPCVDWRTHGSRLKPGYHGSSGLPLIANERVRVMCVREVLSKESRSLLTVSFGCFGRG